MFRPAASERTFDAAGDSGDGEIVAEDRNAGFAHVANEHEQHLVRVLAVVLDVLGLVGVALVAVAGVVAGVAARGAGRR